MTMHEFTNPITRLSLYKLVLDGRDVTHNYLDARQFLDATLDLLQNGATYQITNHYRAAMPVGVVLSIFCTLVFSSHTEHETELWRDNESGQHYLVAYDYSEEDYYSTAYSYIMRIKF